MGDVRQEKWSGKLGSSLRVEHETRIAMMTELEMMISKCPYSKMSKLL